jgi:hypothetical protein
MKMKPCHANKGQAMHQQQNTSFAELMASTNRKAVDNTVPQTLRPSSLKAEQDNWKRTDYRSDSNRSGTFRSTAQAREATRTEGTDQRVRDPSLECQRSTINDRDNSSPRRGPSPRRDRSPRRDSSPFRYRSPRARAARLVEKEKAKTGDKIRHRIVPTNQYRLIRRSYLTAILAVWYLRFQTSTRQHRSAC